MTWTLINEGKPDRIHTCAHPLSMAELIELHSPSDYPMSPQRYVQLLWREVMWGCRDTPPAEGLLGKSPVETIFDNIGRAKDGRHD